MENSNQQLIDSLNALIAKAIISKKEYSVATEKVVDTSTQNIFRKYALQRGFYIAQLQNQVTKLGGTCPQNGSRFEKMLRSWVYLKSIFTSRERNAVINNCVKGDEAVVKSYYAVLENFYITDYVRLLIEAQIPGIELALAEMKLKRIVEEPFFISFFTYRKWISPAFSN